MRSFLAFRFGFALALPGVPMASAALNVDASAKSGPALTSAQAEFFEKRIRPVLAEKCYKCHSADSEKVKGGLLLDTREGIREGGESGHAVVPGDLKESLLLTALKWEDKDMRMPPEKEGGKLSDEVIADFEKWVKMGAPDPRDGTGVKPVAKQWDIEKGREFWAFQAPKAAPAPTVKDAAWPRTEVDKYVRAAQEAKGLKPVADTDAQTLVRRIYFDLIGLPPTPEQVQSFIAGHRQNAGKSVEQLVDQLLASPQFGERWGRHWLDVARYAESTGRERNFTFPEAYRYRDYVIAALNADKPYDQFIREQVAGDLLPHADDAQRNEHTIATGFLALGTKGLNEKNRDQFRMDVIDEQIDTTTRAVLGVTVACARCHDHKFDPIPQKDYYAVAGIFRSTNTLFGTASTSYGKAANKNKNGTSLIPLTSSEKPAAAAESAPAPAVAAPTAATSQSDIDETIRRFIARNPDKSDRLKNLSDEQKRALVERFAGNRPNAGAAPAAPQPSARPSFDDLLKRLGQRDPKQAAKLAKLPEAKKEAYYSKLAERLGNAAPGAAAAVSDKKKKKGNYGAMADAKPTPTGPQAMGVKEGSASDARVLVRGEIEQPADSVPRGFVQVMTHGAAPAIPSASSGRLELAQWLTAPTNPLTARVAVNRVWLHLFGEGLVRTPDNFGATGERPTNPELLDALAVQFMHDGWSVKKLVRTLMLSRTYQLSSAVDRTAMAADPDNRLLWHASPRRLDAEALRDAMLAASGNLDLEPAKGSAVSAIGDGYIGRGIRPESFTGYQTTKRSVYLPVVRDFVPEVLDIFDFAEPSLVVAERDVTNVPSQALYLMNNSSVRTQAAAMAKRILVAPIADSQRIAYAYQITLGRPPTEAERLRADRYLRTDGELIMPASNSSTASADPSWATFCQALFASAEFRYLR